MKKILSIMIGLCVAVLSVVAQTVPETSQDFNMGSATENNISVVVGQPFGGIVAQNGYEIAEGVAQAQLVTRSYDETVNFPEGYEGHGFSYPANTPVGSYEESRYTVHGTDEGYDLVEELFLEILKVLVCDETVYDGNGNAYTAVAVAGHCWTKQNLKPTLYPDGTTEIEGAMVYHNLLHPDEEAMVATYGRLYTWAAATHANADGTVTPDADGYVQGICPNGWHIPTAEEKTALDAENADDLRTVEFWITTNTHTNSTGFTALPAGKYNGSLLSFEGLGTQTDWWSVVNGDGTATPAAIELQYYCDSPMNGNPAASDALSVRCVKNS